MDNQTLNNIKLPLHDVQDHSAKIVGSEKQLKGESGVFISLDSEFERRGSILFYFVIILFMPFTLVTNLMGLGEKSHCTDQIWCVGKSVIENFKKNGRTGFFRFNEKRKTELLIVIDYYGFKYHPTKKTLEPWLDFRNAINVRSGLFPSSSWDIDIRYSSGGSWTSVRFESGSFTFKDIEYCRLNQEETKAQIVTQSSVFQSFIELYGQLRNGAILPPELTKMILSTANSLNATYHKELRYIKCPGLLDAPGVSEFGRSDGGMGKTVEIALLTNDPDQRHICAQNIESYNEGQLRAMHNFLQQEKLTQKVNNVQQMQVDTSDGHSTNDSMLTDLPPIPEIPDNNNNNNNNNNSGGLFGNNNNNSVGMFGNNNNCGGLFGNSNNNNSGGLFGNTNNNGFNLGNSNISFSGVRGRGNNMDLEYSGGVN